MGKIRTPLYNALIQHCQLNPLSFHVPGHKNGILYDPNQFPHFRQTLQLDLTEIANLDDLYAPEGIIKEAQQLAAELYGVSSTYFLVNGSTVGNLAMILANCQKGDVVFVQRNSHKSVMHGLELAGAKPVFLSPKFDEGFQVPSYVPVETVKKAFQKYPQVKAIILTSPTYYGLTYTKLNELIQFAHSRRVPVLVDEAHGAHLIASSSFPKSAVSVGADVVVQSAHKTLPAMTMGAFLHVNSKLVNEEKISHYIHMLQTSSPSYLIMASLDLARAYVEDMLTKEEELNQTLHKYVEIFQQLDYIDIVSSKDPFVAVDPLKLTIRSQNAMSGYDLMELFEKARIYPELADPLNVLFVLPFAKEFQDTGHFSKVSDILKNTQTSKMEWGLQKEVQIDEISQLSISYEAMENCTKTFVSLEEAIGEISAEMIIPYPPGIPFLMRGEKITKNQIEALKRLMKLRANFQGGKKLAEGLISIFKKR
ncbi:aminotransferase class I/II-fold pyridoxal phosphate-dependent enzyme [Aeribacillus sp. FSL K6-3256]|uniref:aminotransferase class I/II-fold pyridoxal phosphate-dependent enzyme n=1 Tax=Aeribacillus sp. FSL K6-3256 TaxID=2954613 RepID=UPI0030CB937F